MTRLRPSAFVVALLLAACTQERDVPGADAHAGSAMEFQGLRPCADCRSIEAWLRLDHQAGARRYRMVERYDLGRAERRFEETGEWAAEGDLLRLRAQQGGERVYMRLPDGRLHARDGRGRPLPGATDEVLEPVSFDHPQ